MNVLVTGPSCAGKTTYGRSRRGCLLIELDLVPRLSGLASAVEAPEPCLFEGLPSGSDEEITGFIERMDRVLVLATPFDERLRRIIDKDGPLAFGCFLYNEYAWRSFLLPLLSSLPQTRTVLPDELPEDPFRRG